MTRERFIAILKEEGIREELARQICYKKPEVLDFNEEAVRLACHMTFTRMIFESLPKYSPNESEIN